MLKDQRDWRRRNEQSRGRHRPAFKSVQDELQRDRSRQAAEKVAVERARKGMVSVEKSMAEVVAVEKLGGDAGGKVVKSVAEDSQRVLERKLLVAERLKVREEQSARRKSVMERARKEPISKALISSSSEEETEGEVVLAGKGSTAGAVEDVADGDLGVDGNDDFLDFITVPEILS